MEKIYIKGFVTKGEGNTYKVLASTASIDRQGDSIDQSGWDLTNYKSNPVMLWAHNYSELPVAKSTAIGVTSLGLESEFEFAPMEANPKAQQIKSLYDNGFLNAVSVGFMPKQRNGNSITKAELLEISFVPVPANQDALRLAYKSIEGNVELKEEEKAEIKSWLEKGDIKEIKGAVSDELDEEQMFEQKWANWCLVSDVMSAFWSAYFDETAPVESFGSLLAETIGLLGELTDSSSDENDDNAYEQLSVKKTMGADAIKSFMDAMAEKSGKTLSAKTLDSIEKAIIGMKDVSTVLEELKTASAGDQDGNGEDKESDNIDEKHLILDEDDLKSIRFALVSHDKTHELALSIVNEKMREMGIKK